MSLHHSPTSSDTSNAMPVAVIILNSDTLAVLFDGQDAAPPGVPWGRARLGDLLDALIPDRSCIVRIEIRQLDDPVLKDIIHDAQEHE